MGALLSRLRNLRPWVRLEARKEYWGGGLAANVVNNFLNLSQFSPISSGDPQARRPVSRQLGLWEWNSLGFSAWALRGSPRPSPTEKQASREGARGPWGTGGRRV